MIINKTKPWSGCVHAKVGVVILEEVGKNPLLLGLSRSPRWYLVWVLDTFL
jgi:hypothetical protein